MIAEVVGGNRKALLRRAGGGEFGHEGGFAHAEIGHDQQRLGGHRVAVPGPHRIEQPAPADEALALLAQVAREIPGARPGPAWCRGRYWGPLLLLALMFLLLQFRQAALHQPGQLVGIAEGLQGEAGILHLAQKGLLARAVDWIIQPLGRDARIFRLLIEQKHQPLQGMGRIGGGFELQLGVGNLRPIPHR